MESRLFADRKKYFLPWFLALVLPCFTGGLASAAISEQEVAALTRMGEAQGRSADDMKQLIEHAQRLDARGLPADALLDKIKEGLAKGIETSRIEQRLGAMAGHLETADSLLKETGAGRSQMSPQERGRSLEVLAEALGRGVTPDEVRAMHRAIGEGNREVRAETLAYGAKGMAFMKEGGLSPDESHALIAAASRRGVEHVNLLDLARELKSRGQEFRENPARLREIRSAVERGERLEKILGDVRERHDRPRPEPRERPERPFRPHRR